MKDTEGQQIRTEQQIRVCELIYENADGCRNRRMTDH